MKLLRILAFSLTWTLLNIFDKERIKDIAYYKGYRLSQRFKIYKGWDEILEPMIIRQFAFLFGVANSFIKGLISDNKPDKSIDDSLKQLKDSIDIKSKD